MMIIEKSFPRGGIPKSSGAKDAKENINFGAVQTKTKKTKTAKKDTRFEEDQNDNAIESISAEPLTNTIQERMLVMGMVKAVDQLFLTLSLPGRLLARVNALEISEAYTKITNTLIKSGDADNYKPLTELFDIGQIVYGRVVELKQKDRNSRVLINMSLKPSEVHADLLHSSIRKGFVFHGAIEEVQEHGYIIETGINGLRTFLPFNKTKQGYAIGQLIPLKVEKITTDKAVSTCQCREIPVDGATIKCSQDNPNLDYILPATIVNFQVSKILKDGLQGTIMDETFTAYVNEHQLNESLALPEDFSVGQKYKARILYVMPLTKLVYLSLNFNLTAAPEAYKRGDIIEKSKVHHLGTGGVVLVINNKLKGLIPYKIIKANYKGNYDQDELLIKYATKTDHKVRVLEYDPMDALYLCTDDAAAVKAKVFVLEDLKPGEFVTAVIQHPYPRIGGYTVQVGKIKGIIEKLYLTAGTKPYEAGARVRCRVVGTDAKRKIVSLTNRPEYMRKDAKLLWSEDMIKKNAKFLGTIVRNEKNFFIVKFFNNIGGILQKQQLHEDLLALNQYDDFSEGQAMQFRIVSYRQGKVLLGLAEASFSMGELYSAEVQSVLESGLHIRTSQLSEDTKDGETEASSESKGLIPTGLLSEYHDLLPAKLRTFEADSPIEKAVCLHRNIFSLRDVAYFEGHAAKQWKDLKIGDVLRAFVKNVHGDIIELLLPIRGLGKLVKLHLDMLLMKAFKKPNIELVPDQIVYVRIIGKEEDTKTVSVSARLTDVWDGDFSSTCSFIKSYFSEREAIKKHLKKAKDPLGKFTIGDQITVAFEGVSAARPDCWQYADVKSKVCVLVKPSAAGRKGEKLPQVGAQQNAVIIWIDYSNNCLYASTNKTDIAHISKEAGLSKNLVGAQEVSAKVLLKLEQVLVCSLKKGPSPLVFCPTRLHYNDFECAASIDAKEDELCKLAFIDDAQPIAMLQSAWKMWHPKKENPFRQREQAEGSAKKRKATAGKDIESEKEKTTNPAKKIKLQPKETVEQDPSCDKESFNDGLLFFEDKQPDQNELSRILHMQRQQEKNISEPLASVSKKLPGISDFWTTDLTQVAAKGSDNLCSDSSEDSDVDNSAEDVSMSTDQKKRKKLSAVEQFKKQREEEARLRAVEAKYADSNHVPETVDQFDRLVLSQPNDSKLWINYMVFHLQAAEIEKARVVARRALKSIGYRNTEDILNIWVALLNLELRYGSSESFNDTLREALTYNEPLKVYLRSIEILQNSNKHKELTEMISLVTKKFKSEPEAWKASAEALFSIGLKERAQQLLHRALASLPERDHLNTIVMFANLNHKHGCNEMAHTLFDQIVVSYPKRVDVWTQYVDTLIKDQLIESARSVLERAVIQKIPLKKMRTIFKKYLDFEIRFGSPSDVEKVKKIAVDYVEKSAQL